jgi:hypothetical protein
MGDIKRNVMKFLIPVTVQSVSRDDLVGRTIIPVYINPQRINIQESKLVDHTLTKGGYIVQYWGEELTRIQADGITGSGGIEAINILRSVYRNEQIQFKNLLLKRSSDLAEAAGESINDNTAANAMSGLKSILDTITEGGFSGIVNGISSSIESITNAAIGVTENNPNNITLIPSLASFAVTMDIYFQGEKFRGFFKSFAYTEEASSPGMFNYQFEFVVTKRFGERKNFMPWHRNPLDAGGQPRPASIPPEGARLDELTFATTQNEVLGTKRVSSKFASTQESTQVDLNIVSINRLKRIKGPS